MRILKTNGYIEKKRSIWTADDWYSLVLFNVAKAYDGNYQYRISI